MNKQTKFVVDMPSGEKMTAEFTWKAIDFILQKYESMGDAYNQITMLASGPMGITKKSVETLLDFLAAIFVTHHPEVTADIMRDKIPYHNLGDFAKLIQIAVSAGGVEQDPTNPQ